MCLYIFLYSAIHLDSVTPDVFEVCIACVFVHDLPVSMCAMFDIS